MAARGDLGVLALSVKREPQHVAFGERLEFWSFMAGRMPSSAPCQSVDILVDLPKNRWAHPCPGGGGSSLLENIQCASMSGFTAGRVIEPDICPADQGCIAKLHGSSFIDIQRFVVDLIPTVHVSSAAQISFASCESTVSGTAWAGISANRKSPEDALAASDSQYSGGTSAPVIEDPRMSTPSWVRRASSHR